MNMEYNFSEDLKSIREILGFSQSELAEKIGVEQVTISRTELKKTEPSARLLEAVYSFAFDKNIKINKLKEMFWRDDLGANENCFFMALKLKLTERLIFIREEKIMILGRDFIQEKVMSRQYHLFQGLAILPYIISDLMTEI